MNAFWINPRSILKSYTLTRLEFSTVNTGDIPSEPERRQKSCPHYHCPELLPFPRVRPLVWEESEGTTSPSEASAQVEAHKETASKRPVAQRNCLSCTRTAGSKTSDVLGQRQAPTVQFTWPAEIGRSQAHPLRSACAQHRTHCIDLPGESCRRFL